MDDRRDATTAPLEVRSQEAWQKLARDDARRLADDPADRALVAEIRAFMDEPGPTS